MGKAEKIISSFINANFKYCSLIWCFCLCESSRKIWNIRKRCPRLELDDYGSDYEALIKKKGITAIKIKKLRVFVFEIFKTINNINLVTWRACKIADAKVHADYILVRCHKTTTTMTRD